MCLKAKKERGSPHLSREKNIEIQERILSLMKPFFGADSQFKITVTLLLRRFAG